LWKGFWVQYAGTAIADVTYITTFELSHKIFEVVPRESSMVDGACGFLSDLICNFFIVPFDIIAQHRMLQGSNSQIIVGSVKDIINQIYSQQGIKGFYRGLGATILTYGPESAIWWAAYAWSNKLLHIYGIPYPTTEDKSILRELPYSALAGCFAGAVMTTAFQPFDTAKTRLQLQNFETQTKYKNVFQTITTIAKEEGTLALMKGYLSRLFFVCPVGAAMVLSYEIARYQAIK